jgi:hypothetical protein
MITQNEFKCNPCNYETDRLANLIRHKKSKKHIEKSNEVLKVSQMYPKSIPKIEKKGDFICEFCEESFTKSCNLARHRKNCKNKDDLIKNMELLKRENEALKIQLQETKDDKKSFKTIAESNAEANRISSSALAFAMKHYKNAPAIETFSNFAMLLEGNPDHSIAEVAIHHYKKKDLFKFIGDLLVREYKKDNPQDQSMWNTDVTRQAYMICEAGDDEDVAWYTDKGGVKTAKYTVLPILEHIKTDIERYMEDSKKLLLEDTTNTVLKDMIAAQSVIVEIDNGELCKNVIKYLATFFYLDKKPIKLLTQ